MAGLTALNPLFLWLLPLAALPLIFHLFFRLRKQPRVFSTLMFFHRIDPKLNARRRLREWLILLLRTLLLAFVLLALAHPVWFGLGKEGSAAIALVIDNSGSMSGAATDGQSKLQKALDGARSACAQLRPKDSAGIVLLVDDPAAPLPPGLSSDKAALQAALGPVTETEAGGSVALAVERAISLLEGSRATHFEIHVLSDLQTEKWNQSASELRAPRRGTSLVVHRIASAGQLGFNISLTAARLASKSILSGRRIPVEARLFNPGSAGGRVRLNWLDDSGNAGSQELVLPPQTDQTASLNLEPQNPGLRWVKLWIEGDDFAADNRAALVFYCFEKRPVFFAGNPADFGQLPLAMCPGGEGKLSGLVASFIEPEALAAAMREQPSSLVVLTWQALAQFGPAPAAGWTALREFVTAGGRLLVVPAAAPGSVGPLPGWLAAEPQTMQSAAAGLGLTVLDKVHPLFNDLRDDKGEVTLRNVKAFKFLALRSPATNTPILGVDDGRVLMTEQKLGKGRVLASGLAFDSTWSTLPLKPGFVALAQNLVLTETGSSTNLQTLVAGDPLRKRSAETPIQVHSLSGSPLDWKGKSAELTTLPRSGVYSLTAGDETSYIAVCSADKEGRQNFLAGDSLPALGKLSYEVKEFTGSESLVAELRRLERSLDLSGLLLLLALACLALEGWLANPPPLQTRAARGPELTTNRPA